MVAAVSHRRPGRPREVPEDYQHVRTRLAVDDYDALCRIAIQHDRTLAAVVRVAIRKLLRDESGGVIRL